MRVTEFAAEINQAETAIEWQLSGHYTLWPDESAYTTSEFSAAVADPFTGETTLTINGKVQAATEAAARVALSALVTAVTTQRGYAGGQQQRDETTPETRQTSEGEAFTELTFSSVWRTWKTTNQAATYRGVSLGEVNRWQDRYGATRFNEMRSQRRHATGGVQLGGVFKGDMSLAVEARRAALLVQQRALKAAVNAADGVLTYGDWSQTVRVEEFSAEINQAETGIEWSLTASYSLFPHEAGYATADYTVATREAVEEGDEFLTFNGNIAAPDPASANAKLAAVRSTVLAAYGWTLAQRTSAETTPHWVYANGDTTAGVPDAADGTSFLELAFAENYRRRRPAVVVSSTLTVSSREDVPSQFLATTYAGTVTASGPNADAAYTAARARALALGANREGSIDPAAVLRSSTITLEQRQLTGESATEFLRVQFSFEYQSKLSAGRAWLELSTARQRDTFGVDVEAVQGFVAARDEATAQALYQSVVRAVYAGRMVTGETLTPGEQRAQQGANWARQFTRLDFAFQVFLPKAAGAVGLRYTLEVSRDYLTLEVRTTVNGSCFAGSRSLADAAIDAMVRGLNLGTSVRQRRSEDRQRAATPSGALADVHLKVDFTEEIVGRIQGQTGVIELRLTEEINYGGERWAVQDLPYAPDGSGGISIVQPAGKVPGTRTVSGSVTAATLTTAEGWAKRQRKLLTGDRRGNRFPQPERWGREFVWLPRVDGIASGTGANVQLYRVSFTFSELLPDYPATE